MFHYTVQQIPLEESAFLFYVTFEEKKKSLNLQ